jgi:tRNA (cytidine/uridine-2'-O-)-methyltransferase
MSIAMPIGRLSWAAGAADWRYSRRKGAIRLPDASFEADDILLFGSETSGVPAEVRAAADLAIRIPLLPGRRSLNVAVAAGIGLAEALRQTGGLPQ